MKTRSKILGKIFCLFLLAALTLCISTPVFATANTTTLTTTVPSHFNANIALVGKGAIEINGIKLSQTGVVSVERHKDIKITFTPQDGYHLNSVIVNGKSITTDATQNTLNLPPLESDLTLSITFAANSEVPSTGDNSYPILMFYSFAAIASLLGIILLAVNRKRSTNK